MARHRFGDFIERLAASRAAEVEDGQAIRRGTGLQEALLKWLSQRMSPPPAFFQIAQAIEELAVVCRQDHNLRVVASEDRLFKTL
ncbi:hypothetical protein Q3O93_12460 [Ralstonia pseudosolanacearum]|uniref:hypothetical protein n=1 Tax=Ralstonia pseudosolanacearum TaxID=1310165 RepID=UPI002676B404|nr:hypothetical protein [Ralstonia pseudosolanacearum]MDO3532740.1 hypothetical protein [Ralstonia pseudosolanacearum]